MLEWMWILLILIAVIGVIANAARQNSDAKTINYLRQNQRDNTTYYDSKRRPISKMNNFFTVERLQNVINHKHEFHFYDDHDDTWDTIRGLELPRTHLTRGTVWECDCGAREIRFIVWNGKYDKRSIRGVNNKHEKRS